MKKYLLILSLLCSIQIFAQEPTEQPQDNIPENKNNAQMIEALKTAFITKELNLTPEEAQKFWPVYNAYVNEVKNAHATLKEDVVALEEKKVSILKKYQDNFKKILGNDDRVKKCFGAAPKFNHMLRQELKRRMEIRRMNGNGAPGGGGKPPFKKGQGQEGGGPKIGGKPNNSPGGGHH